MDEAAVPAAPQGETSLPRAWNQRKTGTPSVAALGAGDAEFHGPGFPPSPSPGQGRFALWGLLGPKPHPCGM
eukprot:14789196-Alexandrium_andersonii.AAC.1